MYWTAVIKGSHHHTTVTTGVTGTYVSVGVQSGKQNLLWIFKTENVKSGTGLTGTERSDGPVRHPKDQQEQEASTSPRLEDDTRKGSLSRPGAKVSGRSRATHSAAAGRRPDAKRGAEITDSPFVPSSPLPPEPPTDQAKSQRTLTSGSTLPPPLGNEQSRERATNIFESKGVLWFYECTIISYKIHESFFECARPECKSEELLTWKKITRFDTILTKI